jgi:two-component system sensor histidine kinase VicK
MPTKTGRKFFSLKTKFGIGLVFTALIPLLTTVWLEMMIFNQRSGDAVIILVAIFVVNFILILISAWVIPNKLLKSLDIFQQISQAIESGKFPPPARIEPNDELSELARATNKLSQNVQQYIQKANYDKLVLSLSIITDAVIAVDFQRNIILFNRPAEVLTNWSAQQVIGQPIGQVIKVFDKRDDLSSLIYCPVGNNDSSVLLFSRDNLQVNGNQKEVFVNMTTKQIPEGSNINLGAILTLHDITHEKQLEAMKLDFVSMAAHELRTPLTSIKGYLSVFMEENVNKFNSEQQMFLNRISHSTEQLINLVENLLNVSRVERGTFSIFRQQQDWIELVKHITTDLTNKAMDKKIVLTFHDTGIQKFNVEVDKLRMTEVVTNLISNAINYTPVGGSVDVWIEANEREVTTHIKDSGVGIPKEAQNHLFSKFYRVANKLGPSVKGTGLGLYISKAIVEMHHGKIWVNSEEGKGSIFSFTIPLPQNVQALAMPSAQVI